MGLVEGVRQTPNTMSEQLANYIVDVPIYTKIADIEKKVATMSKEKLIQRIQATTTELVKLQYLMREYSVLDWYYSIGDRQKVLHGFFEENIDVIKKGAGSLYNWVVLSDNELTQDDRIIGSTKFDKDTDVWIGYLTSDVEVQQVVDRFSSENVDVNGILFTPLFSNKT